jgi:hypothetical protein
MSKLSINKKQKLILAGIVGFLLIGSALFFFRSKPNDISKEGNSKPKIKTLTIEELPIINLTAKNNSRELVLGIKTKQNFTALEQVEYELIYYLEDGLSRGAMGEIELASGEGEKEILLGTCSRDVCRYDEGVTGGKVIITLVKENQLHSFEANFTFLTSDTPYQNQNLEISAAKETLIVLEGGGLPKELNDNQKFLAGPYTITAETGNGEINLQPQNGSLVFLNEEGAWEEVENTQNLPLGTYLLISSS